MSKKKQKNQKSAKERRLHVQLLAQMITLATSGFGFVAALAWNEAIKSIVQRFVESRVPGSGWVSQLIYALVVTLLGVLITYQLSKIATRLGIPPRD